MRTSARAEARGSPRTAFTLVEMLVVVAIIGLLIAALLPAFGVVRRNAKYAQASAMLNAIDNGIRMFQTEDALGVLPPSVSDQGSRNGIIRQTVKNPNRAKSQNGGQKNVRLTGAHLLAHALIGADGLGTAGFRDLNRDGVWWNDYGDDPCSDSDTGGLYGLNEDYEPCQPRYGGGGYVDEKARSNMKSIQELVDEGKVLNAPDGQKVALDERMFVDPWDTPVLYYKANRAATRVIGTAEKPGIYWLEDNAAITGATDGIFAADGLDFGAGKFDGTYHDMVNISQREPGQTREDFMATDDAEKSFYRVIEDPSVKARPTPVRPDSFLLIAAGDDQRYGTEDDVINWTRSAE